MNYDELNERIMLEATRYKHEQEKLASKMKQEKDLIYTLEKKER